MFGIAIVTVIIIFGVIALIVYKSKIQHKSIPATEDYDLRKIDINDIDKMSDGSDFEMYLYRLLLEIGYTQVYKTVGSRDFGADVVFIDRDGFRNVIQAKRYSLDNPVGISAVQEIYSSIRFYKAKKAIVIASTKYTESCETLAGINYVKLLDRSDLINIIEAFKEEDNVRAQDIIESEPRVILESWNQMNNTLPMIKKDHKAEKYVKSIQSK